MSDVTSLAVPPGWYPDRNESNLVRWWDGQQWTDQTQSTAPAVEAFEQPVSAAAFGWAQAEQDPAVHASVAQPAVAQAQIAPGWYPDNADPSLQRWWDGTQWTTHIAAAVSPAATIPYGAPAGPVSSRNNSMATLSLIISLASFAGLLLVELLPLALAGIIIGGVALRRSRRYAPHARRRGQAIAGIIVGAISLAMTILLTVSAVLVYQQLHNTGVPQTGTQQSSPQSNGGTSGAPSTIAELKQAIAHSVARDSSLAVTTVTCDAQASMVSGSIFDCGAQVADGRWTSVRVTIGKSMLSGMAYSASYGGLVSAGATTSPVGLTVAEIEHIMRPDLEEAWGALSGLACDPSASTTEGSTFQCSVDMVDGRSGEVLITITPPDGYDVSVVRLPEGTGGTSGSDGTDSSDSSDPDVSHA